MRPLWEHSPPHRWLRKYQGQVLVVSIHSPPHRWLRNLRLR
ncbi:hypothetical protein [uncultured Gammaproteobacteria bacterium]|nr:hypothetical protein [uncultured Gammaproteobacteria bacterium]CAC9657031.1 hypothetical protein [uncultured Gammaproteobacteria bacterium]